MGCRQTLQADPPGGGGGGGAVYLFVEGVQL